MVLWSLGRPQASKSRTASLTHLCVVWAQFVMCNAMCVAHPLLLQHCYWSSPVPTVQMWTHTGLRMRPLQKCPCFHISHMCGAHMSVHHGSTCLSRGLSYLRLLSLSLSLPHPVSLLYHPFSIALLVTGKPCYVCALLYGVAQTRRPGSVAVCASCLLCVRHCKELNGRDSLSAPADPVE